MFFYCCGENAHFSSFYLKVYSIIATCLKWESCLWKPRLIIIDIFHMDGDSDISKVNAIAGTHTKDIDGFFLSVKLLRIAQDTAGWVNLKRKLLACLGEVHFTLPYDILRWYFSLYVFLHKGNNQTGNKPDIFGIIHIRKLFSIFDTKTLKSHLLIIVQLIVNRNKYHNLL